MAFVEKGKHEDSHASEAIFEYNCDSLIGYNIYKYKYIFIYVVIDGRIIPITN